MSRLPASVVRGATGRAGAAYYAGVADIMADSARTQSAIIAAQSQAASQALGGVFDSLTRGYTAYLDYKTQLAERSFARDMKIMEFDLQKEALEMKRVEMEEMKVDRQLERRAREMELDKKRRDERNTVFKQEALATAVGLVSEIETLAQQIKAGNAAPGAREAMNRYYQELGNIKRQAVSVGVDPTAVNQLTMQVTGLMESLNRLTLPDGTVTDVDTMRALAPTSREFLMLASHPSALSQGALKVEPELTFRARATRALLTEHAEGLMGNNIEADRQKFVQAVAGVDPREQAAATEIFNAFRNKDEHYRYGRIADFKKLSDPEFSEQYARAQTANEKKALLLGVPPDIVTQRESTDRFYAALPQELKDILYNDGYNVKNERRPTEDIAAGHLGHGVILGLNAAQLNMSPRAFGHMKESDSTTMLNYLFVDEPGHWDSQSWARWGYPGAAETGKQVGDQWVSFDGAMDDLQKRALRGLYEAVQSGSPSLLKYRIQYYNDVSTWMERNKDKAAGGIRDRVGQGLRFNLKYNPALGAIFKAAAANTEAFDDETLRVLTDFYKGRAVGVYDDLHLERILARRGGEFPPAATPAAGLFDLK